MEFPILKKAYEKFKNWITDRSCKHCDKDEQPEGKNTNDKECPLDTKELGNATWKLLHSMAAYYPERPNLRQKCEIAKFFIILSKYYPCSICAEDFQRDLQEMPPEMDSAESLSLWLCRLHNRVNLKIGKPLFDCSKVSERWRHGWEDGSCE